MMTLLKECNLFQEKLDWHTSLILINVHIPIKDHPLKIKSTIMYTMVMIIMFGQSPNILSLLQFCSFHPINFKPWVLGRCAMTFLGHTSCSSGFFQDFLDHYGSLSNLMGYFSFEFLSSRLQTLAQ